MLRIDTHQHLIPPDYRKALQKAGLSAAGGRALPDWSPETALQNMAELGVGTAMVYPTLIASVSDASHPSWRARALSVYRFWRDMGYAIGALSAGIMTDLFGAAWAIAVIGALTFASGVVVAVAMNERRQ